MNKSLFIQSFKANWKIWMVVTAVMCLLVAQFSAMESGIGDFTTTIFYGLLSVIVPIIYVVVVSNNLVARQVDDGSMAYVLSSPIKRRDVMITQILYLTLTIFVTFLLTMLTHIVVKASVGADSVTYIQIVYLNMGSMLATMSVAGLCFMFSAIFNRSKYSIGCGGMMSVFFILMSMMAMFGGMSSSMDALSNFKYVTLLSLCDNASILSGNNIWIVKAVVLLIITILSYVIGSVWFSKKNLPL